MLGLNFYLFCSHASISRALLGLPPEYTPRVTLAERLMLRRIYTLTGRHESALTILTGTVSSLPLPFRWFCGGQKFNGWIDYRESAAGAYVIHRADGATAQETAYDDAVVSRCCYVREGR